MIENIDYDDELNHKCWGSRPGASSLQARWVELKRAKIDGDRAVMNVFFLTIKAIEDKRGRIARAFSRLSA